MTGLNITDIWRRNVFVNLILLAVYRHDLLLIDDESKISGSEIPGSIISCGNIEGVSGVESSSSSET